QLGRPGLVGLEQGLAGVNELNGGPSQAENNPGVDEKGVLEQQEQEEAERVAANPFDVPELLDGGTDQPGEKTAGEPQGDAARGRPVQVLLQGDEEQEAEEDALEDVLGLGPAHGGIPVSGWWVVFRVAARAPGNIGRPAGAEGGAGMVWSQVSRHAGRVNAHRQPSRSEVRLG